jgi:hypothetical protein
MGLDKGGPWTIFGESKGITKGPWYDVDRCRPSCRGSWTD